MSDETTSVDQRVIVPLWPYDRWASIDEMISFAVEVERLGLFGVAIGDHVVVPRDTAQSVGRVWPDPFVLGAFIAAATTRLRMIFHVLVAPQRNPLITAKQVSTLDVLSGGRVTVGLGAGWIEREFDALGVPFGSRRERLFEHLEAMRALWTDDTPTFSGQRVSFADIDFAPRPLQQPHPPLFVAGRASSTLRTIASAGVNWLPMVTSLEEFVQRRAAFDRACREVGRDRPGEAVPGVRLETPARAVLGAERLAASIRGEAQDWLEAGASRLVAWLDWCDAADYQRRLAWLADALAANP